VNEPYSAVSRTTNALLGWRGHPKNGGASSPTAVARRLVSESFITRPRPSSGAAVVVRGCPSGRRRTVDGGDGRTPLFGSVRLAATGEFHRAWWRSERDAIRCGLRQLHQLRRRALVDAEIARREVADLLLTGEIEIVPDERGMVPDDPQLVAGHYSGLIAAYERRLVTALRNARVWVVRSEHARPRQHGRPRGRRRNVRTRPQRARAPDDPHPEPDPRLARPRAGLFVYSSQAA
jgi:hypothetical protein